MSSSPHFTDAEIQYLESLHIPFTNLRDNLRSHLDWLKQMNDLGQVSDIRMERWLKEHALIIDGHGTRGRYSGSRDTGNHPPCRCLMCRYRQSLENRTRHANRKLRRQGQRGEFVKSLLEDGL